MRQPTHNTAKLPQRLLDELGASTDEFHSAGKKRNGRGSRKEQRKAARVEKKTRRVPVTRGLLPKQRRTEENGRNYDEPVSVRKPERATEGPRTQPKALKSILKAPKMQPSPPVLEKRRKDQSQSPPPQISRGTKDRLAEDDAEIAALEKALGLKDKKNLPKSFEDDGLDFLMEDLDDLGGLDGIRPGKRKRDEGQEWLDKKRQKAQAVRPESESDGFDGPSDFKGLDSREDSMAEDDEIDDVENPFSSDEDLDEDDEDAATEEDESPSIPKKRVRENPYVAPPASSDLPHTTKYIPPSLRAGDDGDQEDLSQLRRQIQGLMNRLSEANLLSIVADMEKLYQNNPRQHVSTALLDLLTGLLSDPTSLNDTFIILHAGFIAALYKIIGTDFGAQVIQRIDDDFAKYYGGKIDHDASGKRLTNLMSLLSELYNFQVVGSNLIYGFIRLFLRDLSEQNTELLLKAIRIAGPQLRHDDPTSLKEIVILLQEAVLKLGEDSLSVRMKFMIETINNLKNNRMKTGIAASSITSTHITAMKKTLGSLNQRSIRATEPLRIGLKDLRDTEKRGKWWLVGASYRDENQREVDSVEALSDPRTLSREGEGIEIGAGTDLALLVKEHRMNTDVRRSIFISIMSATDYNDAYIRLMKLRLKKSQELEIPKVLIHCAEAEKSYNPFYTLLSRRVCSDRKLKMAFQFSLWDLFKQMGEGDDDPAEDENEDEGRLGLRSLVNLAKMFGTIVAEDGLGLGVLKNLNLAYLPPKIQVFVEILLITVILELEKGAVDQRNEKVLVDTFLKSKEMSEMAAGLRYFLKKVVSTSDIAGSKQDRETVRWGCRVASDALKAVTSHVQVEL